jgi:long-chain acyl-CoA synthetase
VNLSNLLISSAAQRPEHPAIRFLGRTITYKELNRQVDRLSHGLVHAGLSPGDICVLMIPNSIEWIVAYYALAKVGAVVVPVNFLYRTGELDHIFKDSGARAFIGHKDYLEQPRQVMEHLPRMALRIAQDVSPGQGFIPLQELFADERPFHPYSTRDDDTWAIIYTSGTTGLPKGAMLTHYNLASNAMTVAGMRSTGPEDAVFAVLPFYHIFGQTSVLNASIYLGLTIRVWSAFNAEELFSAIEEEKSSILIAVPTIFNRLSELAEVCRPKSLAGAIAFWTEARDPCRRREASSEKSAVVRTQDAWTRTSQVAPRRGLPSCAPCIRFWMMNQGFSMIKLRYAFLATNSSVTRASFASFPSPRGFEPIS